MSRILRPRPAWAIGLIGLAVLGILAAGIAVLGGAGPARSRQAGEQTLGQTSRSTSVEFSLVLRMDERRVHQFTNGLYDPRSRYFHKFIDAGEFGRRFGPSARELAGVRRALRQDGIRITEEYPQRTAIDVAAPAGLVEKLFGVRLENYRSAAGRLFHAPVGSPVVPQALRGAVTGVAGLDGRPTITSDDVPSSGLTPSGLRTAYDVSPLYQQGIQGQGENIAVIAFAQYDPRDVNAFSQQFGLPQFTPVNVPSHQDGGATDNSTEGTGEADLDLEVVHEIAPQATILNYNAPFTTASGADAFGEVLDQIVADGKADIVSDSYGGCELTTQRSDIQRDEQAIEAAMSHGISLFKSTGDHGAYECQNFNGSDNRLSAEWPPSSPGVVAVGGTTLSVTSTGAYAGETAWEGTISQAGGGGGLSVVFPRPSWQQAPGVDTQFSNGKRQIPDVSASADPDAGYATVSGGQVQESGGTSAATPFWAASMALIEQYAHQNGVSKLGFVDPMLYKIASTPQRAAPFHDITVGNNRYYPAAPGWDFATGLGSPDVYNLAQDIVDYLKANPPS